MINVCDLAGGLLIPLPFSSSLEKNMERQQRERYLESTVREDNKKLEMEK